MSSLTECEIGNVLWRENQQKKLKDPASVAVIFSEALASLRKFGVDSMATDLEVAIGWYLAFCGASYAYLAEKENFKLVTADIDLLKKCKVAISINEMK